MYRLCINGSDIAMLRARVKYAHDDGQLHVRVQCYDYDVYLLLLLVRRLVMY